MAGLIPYGRFRRLRTVGTSSTETHGETYVLARIPREIFLAGCQAFQQRSACRYADQVAVSADDQIKQIKASAEKGRWFSKQQDDTYVLNLKNGNKSMEVGGHTHFQVKDAATAVKFFDTAKKAAQAGELDKALSETAFKRKPKSTEDVASNDKGGAGGPEVAKQ
ncbi:hypothetical protein [Achromobacter animicus]|uniref:hypothetical protein n=1 Tax=Achromobacter animicus TaxID=1389935 RepID=UPI0015821054|nr:hypothetical protein [Achromobacter animicus]